MVSLVAIFILLVVYQLKHFLADYPLQTSYMLGKFKDGFDWIMPLVAHCAVHAGFTFVIAATYLELVGKPDYFFAWMLANLDFTFHFVMDRIKYSPNLLGRFKALSSYEYMNIVSTIEADKLFHRNEGCNEPLCGQTTKIAIKRLKSNTYFWWALGWDQMIHHLTHYFIIWLLVL